MAGELTILGGEDIRRLLDGREREIVDVIRGAYCAHGDGRTMVPPSSFLRFNDGSPNRIIALPAFVGGDRAAAGIKWIASFPGNVARGVERASALVVLNALETGWPEAVLEGSVISAKRTAASAILAAHSLREPTAAPSLGLIGCGRINYEIASFALATMPDVRRVVLCDLDRRRADQLRAVLESRGALATVVERAEDVLAHASIVSFATVAAAPYLEAMPRRPSGATWLHVSLRDLAPAIILDSDNIVDDPEHVCRERTSLHLAEMHAGDRRFIRATLADVLTGAQPPRQSAERPVVFSPFGLGILDVALAAYVLALARAHRIGDRVDDFLPRPWWADTPCLTPNGEAS